VSIRKGRNKSRNKIKSEFDIEILSGRISMDLTKRSGEPILEADFYFFCQSTDYSMSSMATGDPIGIESAESGHLTGGLVQGLILDIGEY
jgi:hypothetical protein